MARGKKWDKEKITETLKGYFLLGYSINKACDLAEFPQSTFSDWVNEDKELRQKVRSWQGRVSAKARQNIVSSVNRGDEENSKWWLERRENKDFSKREVKEHDVSDDSRLSETLAQFLKENGQRDNSSKQSKSNGETEEN